MKYTAYPADEAKRIEEIWRVKMTGEKPVTPKRKPVKKLVTAPMRKAQKKRERLLANIREIEPATLRELRARDDMGLTQRQFSSQIQKLREYGFIINVGDGNVARWQTT